MKECFNVHKLVLHGNHFEEGHRPTEHNFKKEKEKLKCRTLIETNLQVKPKYRDEKGNEYPDIESFRNRTSLPKIEIKESPKKRTDNIISPRGEGRTIKVRITNKSYQTNNEEEREEECKDSQVEGEKVTEEEPLFDIMYDDKNSSVEL